MAGDAPSGVVVQGLEDGGRCGSGWRRKVCDPELIAAERGHILWGSEGGRLVTEAALIRLR